MVTRELVIFTNRHSRVGGNDGSKVSRVRVAFYFPKVSAIRRARPRFISCFLGRAKLLLSLKRQMTLAQQELRTP